MITIRKPDILRTQNLISIHESVSIDNDYIPIRGLTLGTKYKIKDQQVLVYPLDLVLYGIPNVSVLNNLCDYFMGDDNWVKYFVDVDGGDLYMSSYGSVLFIDKLLNVTPLASIC